MGGCVGTQRGNGGRGSRRPSAFSDSTSSGLHGGTATKNRPLRHEKIRWKSDIPLTDGQLKSKRDEFWDTAPAFEGKVEIWNALKAAAEAAESDDFDLAQAILDGAGISLPNGSLVECYDGLGTRYAIPVYCLSYPLNIVVESDRDSPAEFSEPITSNHPEGHDHKVRVRISLTGDDVVLIVNTADSVMAAKRKLQSQETPKVPEPSRQRWYYSGKLLGDKMRISDINIPTGFVIQCVVNNLEFGVIRTKE